ncbi:MAG: WbqC family protein [Flavobacteriales bacterium]|nr:WbqC family protein [Flavobacteriales bacterium]
MNTSIPNTSQTELASYGGKRLGIMQPYFFPYLGYFGLIAATDRWIIFDPVQYIRKGWMNRNRVLKQGGGVKYVGVTMAPHARETVIHQMRLAEGIDHLGQLVRNLDYYKTVRAPYYAAVISLLEECFAVGDLRLMSLLSRCLQLTCGYIGIPLNFEVYSRMELEHEPARGPGDWALNISSALKVKTYINSPGAREYFDPQAFRNAGVELLYLEQELPPYDQRTPVFEPGLSIIDVMMFNDPSRIREMVARYNLLGA